MTYEINPIIKSLFRSPPEDALLVQKTRELGPPSIIQRKGTADGLVPGLTRDHRPIFLRPLSD